MSSLTQVAELTAVKKELDKLLDSKSSWSLRAEVDADLMASYEADGTDRRRIQISGVEVGTHSIRFADGPEIWSREEFEAWARENNLLRERVIQELDPRWVKFVQPGPHGTVISLDGEVVPGVQWIKKPVGTTLRVDEKKVIPLLAPQVQDILAIEGEVE